MRDSDWLKVSQSNNPEIIIFKNLYGIRFSPEFERFLIAYRINELYLVGLDAEFCVYYTAKGALNRGYNVNVITDGIFLLADEKWEKLIQKYENDGIILKTSNECINGSF